VHVLYILDYKGIIFLIDHLENSGHLLTMLKVKHVLCTCFPKKLKTVKKGYFIFGYVFPKMGRAVA
jgi:hypothetical protein